MSEHDDQRDEPGVDDRGTESDDLDDSTDRDDSTPLPTDDEGRSFPRLQAAGTDAPPSPSGEEREYTGEPIETEDGWVLPQQQNVGPGQMASTAET